MLLQRELVEGDTVTVDAHGDELAFVRTVHAEAV